MKYPPDPMSGHVAPEDYHPGSCVCPFCGADLEDPMAAFFDHLEESAVCSFRYEPWRRWVQIEGGRT